VICDSEFGIRKFVTAAQHHRQMAFRNFAISRFYVAILLGGFGFVLSLDSWLRALRRKEGRKEGLKRAQLLKRKFVNSSTVSQSSVSRQCIHSPRLTQSIQNSGFEIQKFRIQWAQSLEQSECELLSTQSRL